MEYLWHCVPLQVRKDVRDGFSVVGLHEAPCPSAPSALRHMQKALQLRHTRSHRLNEYSSRSHCMMTFAFASQAKAAPDGGGADGAEAAEQGAKGGIRKWVLRTEAHVYCVVIPPWLTS